ncbi:hypothetical protein ACFWVU_28430 [Streptomyces sp. NPDC058686]|uniref:hypothetical protein n=1 Tax=Streptomyces sp. NPDC058686 TaxID=3346599 RepID=UPI00365ED02E
MTRGTPSSADQFLIQIAAASGMKLSTARLERWRAAGLLPRQVPENLVRFGKRSVYSLATTELAMGLLACAPYARRLDDLVLLAFFNEVAVPGQCREACACKGLLP